MSILDLPIQVQKSVAVVKEVGAIGLALLIVCFYLGQQAGLIANVDRVDHDILIQETTRQTVIIIENQRLLTSIVTSMHSNQVAFLQLARGICLSVTKTSDIEARCLSVRN